jgi:hypothetical protein
MGVPTSAGSASRREKEFPSGGGQARPSGEASSSFFVAYPFRVRRCCQALVTRSDTRVRVGEGVLAPRWGWVCMGDGTQRLRAGLSSGGPPGLGPRLGKIQSCRGVSESDPVLPCEFSIPIPIPTRVARRCRAGSSFAGGVSGRMLRMLQPPHVVSLSNVNPRSASRLYLLKSLRDWGTSRRILIGNDPDSEQDSIGGMAWRQSGE